MNEFEAIRARWFDNTCDDAEQAVRDCRTLLICYEVAQRELAQKDRRIKELEQQRTPDPRKEEHG